MGLGAPQPSAVVGHPCGAVAFCSSRRWLCSKAISVSGSFLFYFERTERPWFSQLCLHPSMSQPGLSHAQLHPTGPFPQDTGSAQGRSAGRPGRGIGTQRAPWVLRAVISSPWKPGLDLPAPCDLLSKVPGWSLSSEMERISKDMFPGGTREAASGSLTSGPVSRGLGLGLSLLWRGRWRFVYFFPSSPTSGRGLHRRTWHLAVTG